MTHRRLQCVLLATLSLVACNDRVTAPEPDAGRPFIHQPPTSPLVPPAAPPTNPFKGRGPTIFLAATDGSLAVPVTTGGWPAFSPSGKVLAYHDQGHVWLLDLESGSKTRLAEGGSPAWSGDGRSIAFTSRDGIAIMDADGAHVRTIVRHDFRKDTYAPWDMGIGKPSWSPTGDRIAFEHLGDGDMQPAQIFVVNTDGTGIAHLTSPGGGIRYAESDPAWSPDGNSIALWSWGWGLALLEMGSGQHRSLVYDFPTVAYGARPTWSPDGTMLTYIEGRFGAPGRPQLWIMPAAGGLRRLFIDNAYDISWSADGKRLAFVRDM